MMASRGMGAISPSKIPGAKKKRSNAYANGGVIKTRKDGDKFTEYAKGGAVGCKK